MENDTSKNAERSETPAAPAKKTKIMSLLEDLRATTYAADLDLSDWDWRTRPGMEIKKSEAKRDLVDLRAAYLKEFSTKVAKVFIDGTPEQVSTLATLITKEGVIALTAPNIYEFLASNVESRLSSGNIFSSAAWFRLTELISDTCRTFDIFPSESLVEPPNTPIYNNDDLVNVIKAAVRHAFGDTLNKVYLTSNFLNTALVNKFDKELTILIVSGLSESEKTSMMESLFPGQPSFSLSLAPDEVPDKSTALKVYRRVVETFNKKANKRNTNEISKVESH